MALEDFHIARTGRVEVRRTCEKCADADGCVVGDAVDAKDLAKKLPSQHPPSKSTPSGLVVYKAGYEALKVLLMLSQLDTSSHASPTFSPVNLSGSPYRSIDTGSYL